MVNEVEACLNPKFTRGDQESSIKGTSSREPDKAVKCPWCSCKFDPGLSVTLQSDTSATRPEAVEVQQGALAPHAASVLMKLL